MFDVHSDCYWDYELMDQLQIHSMPMDDILIDSKWDCIVRNQCLKSLVSHYYSGKILLNYNACIVPLFYRLHSYIIHIVIVTVINIVIVTGSSQ